MDYFIYLNCDSWNDVFTSFFTVVSFFLVVSSFFRFLGSLFNNK